VDTTPKIIARGILDIHRSLAVCHHKAKGAFVHLEQELARDHKAGIFQARFEPFESFRSPYRQEHLLASKTTKAGAWQSAHQYGLAVDFVPRMNGRWTWLMSDLGDYDMINFRRCVGNAGLYTPIEWDPFHVEHPLWFELKQWVV